MTILIEGNIVVERDGQGAAAAVSGEVGTLTEISNAEPEGPIIGDLALPGYMLSNSVPGNWPFMPLGSVPAQFITAVNGTISATLVMFIQAPTVAWTAALTNAPATYTLSRLGDWGIVLTYGSFPSARDPFQIVLSHPGDDDVIYEFFTSYEPPA